jgi:hypothetical protein
MKTDAHYGFKGTYVHDACRLYLLNDLDEDTLDPVLIPYISALKKFLSDSKGMRITGVFDIKSGAKSPIAELQISAYIELVNHGTPQNDLNRTAPILWLEEPFYHETHRFAGTPDIVIGNLPVKEGFALYLKDNGKYSLSTIKNTRINFETFLCFLRAEKFKREKGLL